jgi:gas vesicle protein
MRYKQLVSDKLDQTVNTLNVLRSAISMGDAQSSKQIVETVKERLEEIQTLINTEHDDTQQF